MLGGGHNKLEMKLRVAMLLQSSVSRITGYSAAENSATPLQDFTTETPQRMVHLKTDHGMKALFRCKDGYKLSGPNVTECSFGRWTGETPTCNESWFLVS
ncbi:hypothetical protein CEXT_485791 [Caerostris extrusa]|uniref:Sushi domain-containing protein n=1 Tax=Caerostris extrusa TaxID=172846 RepID=A0AAV4WIH8_CAEEX|nr:hypothetical protein CEXT_485791 [Caerostris extrusa]